VLGGREVTESRVTDSNPCLGCEVRLRGLGELGTWDRGPVISWTSSGPSGSPYRLCPGSGRRVFTSCSWSWDLRLLYDSGGDLVREKGTAVRV